MSDYCFDVSERIARETDIPKTELLEVDTFLARKHRREFYLYDIEDFTSVGENSYSILNEYIKHGIVAKESRYFCPKHKNTVLERPKILILSRQSNCPKCEKSYSVEGLETETIFTLKKGPDRPLPSDARTTSEATSKPERHWYKDPKWIAERIGIPIFLIVAGVILRGALTAPPATNEPLEMPTSTEQFEPSSTPTSAETPTITATPSDPPTATTTPIS